MRCPANDAGAGRQRPGTLVTWFSGRACPREPLPAIGGQAEYERPGPRSRRWRGFRPWAPGRAGQEDDQSSRPVNRPLAVRAGAGSHSAAAPSPAVVGPAGSG